MNKSSKISIVCNSVNPDLVEYFKCKIEALEKSNLKDKYIILKNKQINLKSSETIISSYTNSAFFDKFVILDFLRSLYISYLLLKNDIILIHFTTAHISNIFLSIFLKPFSIKQIFTIHDLTPHPGKKAFFIKIYNKFVINILADKIISFSKKEIEHQQKKEKFEYFVLSGFEQYLKKPKLGNKTILFFGRIEGYKGLDNLLDLIEKANQINLGYKFIIAGKGKIENIEHFNNLNNVEIINRFISDHEVKELFQSATFTILPYHSATQSGVTILSYSYATPVIAYDVGALSEYIDDKITGFIVDYKNNNAIIDILSNITNTEILNLSENTIRVFSSKYSKKACRKKYIEFYNNLLQN